MTISTSTRFIPLTFNAAPLVVCRTDLQRRLGQPRPRSAAFPYPPYRRRIRGSLETDEKMQSARCLHLVRRLIPGKPSQDLLGGLVDARYLLRLIFQLLQDQLCIRERLLID